MRNATALFGLASGLVSVVMMFAAILASRPVDQASSPLMAVSLVVGLGLWATKERA